MNRGLINGVNRHRCVSLTNFAARTQPNSYRDFAVLPIRVGNLWIGAGEDSCAVLGMACGEPFFYLHAPVTDIDRERLIVEPAECRLAVSQLRRKDR